jgi:uncharacterized membrane protein
MIFSPDIFPLWLFLLTSVIAALGFLIAVIKAPWKLVLSNSERQHLIFGASILLGLFSIMRVDTLEVITFHPLVITAVTLMIGWHFSILAGAISQLILLVAGVDDWSMLGVNFLVTVIIPATVSYGVLKVSQRISLRNLFVFLLGVGFLGAALSSIAVVTITVVLLFMADYDLSISEISKEAPLLLLLIFPEGFLNGTIVTAVTVFKPHLMMTFNEEFYLSNTDKKS